MVWVKYKEKWGGEVTRFWKREPSIATARKEVRNWNAFDNPREHLSIVKSAMNKPSSIKKTRYKGIYK